MIATDSPAAGIVRLTIDLPPVNALDVGAIAALTQAFRAAAADPPAIGVLLTGAGTKAFCAGVDVRAFAALDHAGRLDLARAITGMTAAAFTIPCPVVALVNGHALGGGLVLALATDWRIAADTPSIRLGLPEAQAGVPFPQGPLAILRHLLPGTLLRRLALSSAAHSPADMHGFGLVDELAELPVLTERGIARLQALAAQPGFAIVKRQVNAALAAELTAVAARGEEPFWEQLA